MKTTRQKIKQYLESGKTLDNIKAWELFKTMSLQQHIHSLRNSGMEISMVKTINNKTKKWYAIYFLKKA